MLAWSPLWRVSSSDFFSTKVFSLISSRFSIECNCCHSFVLTFQTTCAAALWSIDYMAAYLCPLQDTSPLRWFLEESTPLDRTCIQSTRTGALTVCLTLLWAQVPTNSLFSPFPGLIWLVFRHCFTLLQALWPPWQFSSKGTRTISRWTPLSFNLYLHHYSHFCRKKRPSSWWTRLSRRASSTISAPAATWIFASSVNTQVCMHCFPRSYLYFSANCYVVTNVRNVRWN